MLEVVLSVPSSGTGVPGARRSVRRAVLIGCLVLGTAACSMGSSKTPSSSGSVGSSSTAGSAQPSLALNACPVTPPGGPRPPTGLPPAPYAGNGQLWVGLWPHGLVVVPPDDISRRGVLRMKFMWYRESSVHGVLHINGSQLDADDTGHEHARTVAASLNGIPHSLVQGRLEAPHSDASDHLAAGYGLTGFNASSIFFSGQGCYRVTGRAGGASLSFVTLVRTCSVLHELSPRQRKAISKNLAKNWCPG